MKWNELIGQTEAKSRLEFHLEGFKAGQPMPSLFFVGPRGFGKTSIATALGLKLQEMTGGKRKFYLVNSATVKNDKQLVESILIPYVQDKDATIMFDEAHMLNDKVTAALLTVTQPNHEHWNTYSYGDMNIDIDLTRNSFFFGTTEPHKVNMPLMNRTKRVDLVDYSYLDLSKIIHRNAPDIKFKDGTLMVLASVCRSTARQAVMMADDIQTFLAPKHSKVFTKSDWESLRKRLSIHPLGLSGLELQVLKILGASKDVSLTRLAATMCMTPQSVRQDCELYLLKNGLIEIQRAAGRNVTPAGKMYLKAIDLGA
jgi:Holliday junction resolvasome RuvABC ATP-dependent DNA helicase subunit